MADRDLRFFAVISGDPLLRRIWEQMGRPDRCRVVGGWVRDRLLGRPTGDLDLTIEGAADIAAKPAKRLASALGANAHLLGTAPHRVWRIETAELKVELWPMGALSHRQDMMRRDFGVNALSVILPDGPLEDLVGGIADLEAKRLRAISRTNLEDDPIRLLRCPRFLAQIEGSTIDARTRTWIADLAPSLATAPRERVGQEFTSMLRAARPSRGFRQCLELGLFEPAAPAAATVDGDWLQANLAASDRLCRAGVSPESRRSSDVSTIAGLAFLFRAWGTPTAGMLAPYSWPKPARDIALRAARLLDRAVESADAPAADRRELAWRAGEAFPALIGLGRAIEPHRPWRRWWRQWRRNPGGLTDPRPLLSGDEIGGIAGIEPGPDLGKVVKQLLRAQVRGEIRTKGGARAWLRNAR